MLHKRSHAEMEKKQIGRTSRGSGTAPAIAESHQMKPTWNFTEQSGKAKSSTPEKVPHCLKLIAYLAVLNWSDEPLRLAQAKGVCQEKQSQDNTTFWSWTSGFAITQHCFSTGRNRVTPVRRGRCADKSSWHSEELPPNRPDSLYLCS